MALFIGICSTSPQQKKNENFLCKNNEFSFSSSRRREKRPGAANNKKRMFQKALISAKFATRAPSRASAGKFSFEF
jgi:hypothetical protein